MFTLMYLAYLARRLFQTCQANTNQTKAFKKSATADSHKFKVKKVIVRISRVAVVTIEVANAGFCLPKTLGIRAIIKINAPDAIT